MPRCAHVEFGHCTSAACRNSVPGTVVDRAGDPPLEDVYEEGDVLWFKSGYQRSVLYTALKIGNCWHLTGTYGPVPWSTLLQIIDDNEVWAVTEWEQLQ